MKKRIHLLIAALGLLVALPAVAIAQDKVAIYRWNLGNDWVEARADDEAGMLNAGYTHRTFVGYLFREPVEGTVAINRWHFVKTDDWVTVREDESSSMVRFGYTDKVLLGYAYATPRSNTVPLNRWNLIKTGDWVTVPETASADMQRFGYTNKTLVAYAPK